MAWRCAGRRRCPRACAPCAPALPAAPTLCDLLELHQALGERRRAVGHRDQVDVLDAVRPAPRRARDLHVRLRAATLAQAGGEALRRSRSPSAAAAVPALARRRLPPSAESTRSSSFGPSPRTPRMRCGERRLAQLLQRVDAELRVQQPRALGAETRQARDRDEPRAGTSRAASPRPGSCPCRAARGSSPSSVAPIPGSSLARPSAGERRDRHRRLAHALGGRAVGEHAVDDRPVELVEVAELVERVGDRSVGELGCGHARQGRRRRREKAGEGRECLVTV